MMIKIHEEADLFEVRRAKTYSQWSVDSRGTNLGVGTENMTKISAAQYTNAMH